jgi:LPXTG-site transpeptidase (sortase) family protein
LRSPLHAAGPTRLIAGLALAATLIGCGSENPDGAGSSVSLSIPKLGVAAPLVPIAAEDRVLNPPKDPKLVGWWSGGAAPGDDTGSTLMVGHTVSTGGGVFDDIDRLAAGDSVTVEIGTGVLSYTVDTVEVLGKSEFANQAEELFSQDVSGRLVLVTCEDWDGNVYNSNVVAVAHPA